MRQALAGMLWSKQYYFYDLDAGSSEHGADPLRDQRRARRAQRATGSTWSTTTSSRCPTSGSTRGTRPGTWPSTPSRWRSVDLDFAKQQLELMLRERLPAPERPDPGLRVELRRREPAGARLGDALHLPHRAGAHAARAICDFLRSGLPRSCCSTSPGGSTARTATAATSSRAASSASTTSACSTAARRCPPAATSSRPTAPPGWRSSAQNMLEIALELARARPGLRGHGAASSTSTSSGSPPRWTASASTTTSCGTRRTASSTTCCGSPTARATRLKVRSMVGLLPLCAVDRARAATLLERFPRSARARAALPRAPPRAASRTSRRPIAPGVARPPPAVGRSNESKLRRVLARMLDESEFLSPYGIRSLSRYHLEHPYVFASTARSTASTTSRPSRPRGLFGGNSNWRGPIWIPGQPPDHARAAAALRATTATTFTVECPTGSGAR